MSERERERESKKTKRKRECVCVTESKRLRHEAAEITFAVNASRKKRVQEAYKGRTKRKQNAKEASF